MSEPADDTLTVAEAARRAGAAPTTELLDAVRAEGAQRRRARRRRRSGALSLAAVLIVALPVAVLTAGDDGGGGADVVAASDAAPVAGGDGGDDGDDGDFADERRDRLTPTSATGTTAAIHVTPTPPPTTAPDGSAPLPSTTISPITASPTAPPPAPGPPPAPVCRNSTDPACGPLRYEPTPANAPVHLVATARRATVGVGEVVTFDVTWSDADARLFSSGADWGEDDGGGVGTPFSCERVVMGFGPWDPPSPAGASGTYTESHAFDEPGTYTVAFWAVTTRTSPPDCRDPYRSEASTGVTVTVTG